MVSSMPTLLILSQCLSPQKGSQLTARLKGKEYHGLECRGFQRIQSLAETKGMQNRQSHVTRIQMFDYGSFGHPLVEKTMVR